jgi:pimeloyl-ACP methyl ester carboxylesterase
MPVKVAGHAVHIDCGGVRRSNVVRGIKPIVVLVHGAGQDRRCWNDAGRWLVQHGYAPIVPDLPGHGRSGGEPLACVEAMAAWLVALLDALGVGHAALVGHSMGSLVALEAALAYPQRFARLALLGCALPMTVSARLLDTARSDEALAADLIDRYSHATDAGWTGGPLVRQRPGVLAADLMACNAYVRPIASLKSLAGVDTLIISGSADRMTRPDAARRIAEVVRHAQLVHVADCGHALIDERPDAVFDSLRVFLSRER